MCHLNASMTCIDFRLYLIFSLRVIMMLNIREKRQMWRCLSRADHQLIVGMARAMRGAIKKSCNDSCGRRTEKLRPHRYPDI